ncbi:MAG TPA: endo-alpha-N-acetylgalactosaminidase family protein [Terriglobia bacterium]|nr:endo-alpha-N-acetylgalactosaminidase family protein [Terriglobia bacterium]
MDQKNQIGRRSFLKASGASLAGFVSTPAWSELLANQAQAVRDRPTHSVVLRSPNLEVILDGDDGVPYEYRLLPSGLSIRGEDYGGKISVTVCRRHPRGFVTTPISAVSVTATPPRADFRFNATYEGQLAVAFVIRYAIEGPTVFVSMESIEEKSGYELIEVGMPRLAIVRESDRGAWLAHGEYGGSLVSLNQATAGQLRRNTFWGKVLATLPIVMIGTDCVISVLEVTSYMDGAELAVAGVPGSRRASFGTVKAHRVNGSLCYDMNTGKGTPRNCGNARTPNIRIEQKSVCRLDFITHPSGAPVDWLDGARLVRSRMPAVPTHYYEDKLVYAVHCDQPLWKEPRTTFAQAESLIRDISALTSGWPQIAHLWGWQYRGKDTGYPAVAEVDERVGGYKGLMHLMEEAQKSNCNATLSDNYDDAYRSSPAWNPAIIARRPDGQLWESRNWTGENSYIIGMAKYMKSAGISRTDYTCNRYRLRDTIHVDVLTYFSIRNDWDPERPASGVKNLVDGRYKVLEEFRKHGVDVSSEALRYAFIGKVSYYWYAQGPSPCPFGGQPIPLLPMIYRQSAAWGQSGREATFEDTMLKMLFYNGCPRGWLTSDADRKDITDWAYLMMIPWFKVHRRAIESFRRDGERTVIGLEGNSLIDLDWGTKSYSVTVDGHEIAHDGSTSCPLDDSRVAFYSLRGKDLSFPLPEGWNEKQMAAFVLDAHKPEPIEVAVKGGGISVTVPPRQPVMVFRDAVAVKERLFRPA